METCPHCKKQFNYSPIYHGVGPNDYGDYSCYDCLSDRDKAAYDACFHPIEAMKTNGNTCEHCGANCIDDCSVCGAPQCCPRCCEDATAEILQKTVKEIKVTTGRIYHLMEDCYELYQKGEVRFVCNGVSLEPRVTGRGGDGFHVTFNWA